MARKKQTKRNTKSASRKTTVRNVKAQKVSTRGFSSQVKLSDSYISLFLGIVVVVGVVALALAFSNRGQSSSRDGNDARGVNSQEQQMQNQPKKQRTYTVQEGEDLWGIADKIYGSGFNWMDIAEANNLQTADSITTGMVLIIPDAPKRTGQ